MIKTEHLAKADNIWYIYWEYILYSREALIDCRQKGYISVLMIPGKNGPHHYVVPDKILENDVSVIDNRFGKTLVSQYEKVYWIVNFRRIENKTAGNKGER